jgi:hypothetical protein
MLFCKLSISLTQQIHFSINDLYLASLNMHLLPIARESELSLFHEKVSSSEVKLQPEILYYYGVNGIGRTFLRKTLANHLTYKIGNSKNIEIDIAKKHFNSFSIDIKIILDIRLKLKSIGVNFLLFDIAYLHYYKSTRLKETLSDKQISHFEKLDLIASITDILKDGFEIIDIAKKTEIVDEFLSESHSPGFHDTNSFEWVKYSLVGTQFILKIVSFIRNHPTKNRHISEEELLLLEEFSEISDDDADRMWTSLMSFFVLDLDKYLKKDKSEGALTIFIDSYENLFTAKTPEWETEGDSWMRTLFTLSRKTLWVLFGVRKHELFYPRPSQEATIKEMPATFHNISLLDIEKIQEKISEVTKNEEISSYIAEESCGIPAVAAYLLNKYRENCKEYKTQLADLQLADSEHNWIIGRYLRSRHASHVQFFTVLAVSGVWDRTLFKYLLKEIGVPQLISWEDLTSKYSFIFPIAGKYTMHERLSKSLEALASEEFMEDIIGLLTKYHGGLGKIK